VGHLMPFHMFSEYIEGNNNVRDKRASQTSELATFQRDAPPPHKHQIPPQPTIETTSYEAKINLVLDAIQRNPKLNNRAAAKIYTVNKDTLRMRRAGILIRYDIPANSRKLTDLEEKTII